jgi:hypothetical protein
MSQPSPAKVAARLLADGRGLWAKRFVTPPPVAGETEADYLTRNDL